MPAKMASGDRPTTTVMSRREALETAIRRAIDELRDVDVESRCAHLGLSRPRDGALSVRMFGMDSRLDLDHWTLTTLPSGEPARAADLVLLLHYLACDVPVTPTGGLVSFRSLTGGQFYFSAFQARTVGPLIDRIGNDLELLTAHLARFDHELTALGDLGARIHALGNLHLTLVYHRGDDEFPPAADLLYDGCIRRVYGAEDAAVMASRICIGLL